MLVKSILVGGSAVILFSMLVVASSRPTGSRIVLSETGAAHVRELHASEACDVAKAKSHESGETDEVRTASVVASMRTWSKDCRAEAMHRLCDRAGCSDDESSPLLSATVGEERATLVRIRWQGNSSALSLGRKLQRGAEEVGAYARSMQPVMRPETRRDASLEEVAEHIANNPCIPRMQRDFARIRALRDDVGAARGVLHWSGFDQLLDSSLAEAMSCVDCTNDRSQCKAMFDDLSAAGRELDELGTAVERDRQLLGIPPLPEAPIKPRGVTKKASQPFANAAPLPHAASVAPTSPKPLKLGGFGERIAIGDDFGSPATAPRRE